MKDYIPTYWLEDLKRRDELENRAIKKVDKEKLLTKGEKEEIKMFISGGLYGIAMNFLSKYKERRLKNEDNKS